MSSDHGWREHIASIDGDAAYEPGMVFEPRDGHPTDLNLFMADLLAGPNPNVPDVMADWTPRSNPTARPERLAAGRTASVPGLGPGQMRVTGYLGSEVYTVRTDDRVDADLGVVTTTSSADVEDLLRFAADEQPLVELTPVGPTLRVGTHSNEAVLVALMKWTEVVDVLGGPDLFDDRGQTDLVY